MPNSVKLDELVSILIICLLVYYLYFKFLDLKIARPTMYETTYYCAIENDGYYFDDNCYSGTYYVRCDGKGKSLNFTTYPRVKLNNL